MDGFSVKGLSGAPVFVHETVSVPLYPTQEGDAKWLCGTGDLFLLGLVHGIFLVDELQATKDAPEPPLWHSGVTKVVPASQVLEILHQPKLLQYEAQMKEELESSASVETSISDEAVKATPQKKNRDIPIPPIGRKKFFDALEKATQRKKPSS